MSRLFVWAGILLLFMMVTTASFCMGKYVLGERLFNKPSIEVQHRPGEQAHTEEEVGKRFAQNRPFGEKRPTKKLPKVNIEVRPASYSNSKKDTDQNVADDGEGSDRHVAEITPDVTESAQPKTKRKSKNAKRDRRNKPSQVLPAPHANENDLGQSVGEAKSIPEDTTVEVHPRAKTKSGDPVRVQVGVFSVKENADTRASQLQKRGYPVVTSSEQRGGQTYYRVHVGPYKDKETASRVKQELSEQGFGDSFVP